MATSGQVSVDREGRLDEAVAQYLAAQAAGQLVDRPQWLAQFPDLADELAEFLMDLDGIQRAMAPFRGPAAALSNEYAAPLAAAAGGSSPAQAAGATIAAFATHKTAERYRLERFHARGGMGEVWLAEDAQIGRRIALKRLRVAEPRAQERFLHEAQITGQLEHPGIVPLHDLGIGEDGEPFYVMKFVQGRSLKEAIAAFHAAKAAVDWPRDVEFRRLLEVFVDICRAVAYAHHRGVLHRDIKPDNVMLGSYGEALLLDWGLAKVLGQPDVPGDLSSVYVRPGPATATRAGDVVGSPAYMSPELATGHADTADQRTDVYLLGATLYEILSGRAPRAGSSQAELVDLARTKSPAPPRKVNARIPRPLEAICLKAMAHGPDQRYASAAALAEDLERYLAGEPVSVYRESLPVRAWRWMRRHQRGLQRTGMGLLVLTLAGFALATRHHAQVLAQREAVRREEGEFRRLADEARFFAASTDPVAEHAPYYAPGRALAAGHAALTIAAAWSAGGERLPRDAERPALQSELYELLLVLAGAQEQADREAKRPPQALLLLDRAAAIRGGSRGYHQLRSRCLARLGRTAESQQEAMRAEDPRIALSALDHFLLGEYHRTRTAGSGNNTAKGTDAQPDRDAIFRALEEYRQAIRLNPQHYWAHFQLGRCYLSLGRGPEAVQALGVCVALRPAAPWAYSTRGLAYGLLGQFTDAHVDLNQALRLDPDFLPARLHRGFVYWRQDRPGEALADFHAVLQSPAERSLIEAAWYRAQIYVERGAWPLALEDCAAVIEQRPAFRPVFWLRARVRLRLGQEAAGLKDLNRYLALASNASFDTGSAEASAARGRALRELAVGLDPPGQSRVLTRALAEFQTAIERGAPADEFYQDLRALPQLRGELQQAIEAATRQLASSPGDRTMRNQRAWAYVSLARYELAEADFREVIRQSPQDAEARSGLGYVLAAQGACVESEREAVRAMLHGGNNYLILHNVACIYAELSRTDKDRSRDDEDLCLALATRAMELFRQNPTGPDEIAFLRQEPAFPASLRARAEFKALIGTSGKQASETERQ
jgi:tetratricopeptide (TPR) repeat protein